MLCSILKFIESLMPLISEVLSTVTLGFFSGVTGKLCILVIREADHEFVIFIATLKDLLFFFPLTHNTALTKATPLDRLLLVKCIQLDRAADGAQVTLQSPDR